MQVLYRLAVSYLRVEHDMILLVLICTDCCVLCSFIIMSYCVCSRGGGLVLWAGESPLVVRVSADCLLVRGNSANLVWGMAYRMSSVRSLLFG